jgi:hypothetical protein
MRTYANEIDSRAEQFDDPERDQAGGWATWIRQHADRTDPINGPLHLLRVTSASHNDLPPHMNGWSTYGPYRQSPVRSPLPKTPNPRVPVHARRCCLKTTNR